MPPNPDRVGHEAAASPRARPALRAAPWVFGAAMLAVVCTNAFAFAHFQDPETPVPWEHGGYQPLRLRSQHPPQRPTPPGCYRPLGELLAGRTVKVPAGTRFPSWEWRYLGLVQVESDPRPNLLFPAMEQRLRKRDSTRWRCAGITVHLPADPGSSREPLHALPSVRSPRVFFLVEESQALQLGGGEGG